MDYILQCKLNIKLLLNVTILSFLFKSLMYILKAFICKINAKINIFYS